MSRRRRNRSREAAPTQAAGPQLQAFALTGYEAARTSKRRGWIDWPTLDSSKMLTGWDRRTILKNAQWAYANIGLARRIVNGLANLVGYLTPQAATADKAWNAQAEAHFLNRAGFAGLFDRAGKHDFFSWQIANTRGRLRDGDLLSVLSETAAGGTARVIIYEAAQIDDGDPVKKPAAMRDGVKLDAFGRHVSYRIVDPEDPRKFTDIAASDCIFHADFERPGQVRGVSALAHALVHIQDRAEVWGDIKHAIKVAAQVGIYKKREKAQPFMGQHFATPPEAETTGDTTDAGDAIRMNVEKVYGSGYFDTLAAGESLELLHDARPHPNQREFLEDLVRDIAWGVGVAPEVLWQLAGQTGPNTRYLMAELGRWIEQEQMRLRAICQRFWVFFIAKEMNAGRLDYPSDENWWRCEWVPQGDLTIDRGREGRLELEQLRMGATNFDEVWKKSGGDFQTGFDRQLDALATAKEKAAARGFQLHEVMPGFFSAPAPEPAAAPAAE